MKNSIYIVTLVGLLIGAPGKAKEEELMQNKPVIQKVCPESFSINHELRSILPDKFVWTLRWPTKEAIEEKKVTYNNRRILRAKLTTWLWIKEIMQSQCVPSSEEVELLALKAEMDNVYDVLRLKYKVDSCVVQIMSIQSSLIVAIKDMSQVEPIDMDDTECVEKYVKGYMGRFFNYSDRLKSTSFSDLRNIEYGIWGMRDRNLDQADNWMSSAWWWTDGKTVVFSFFKDDEGPIPFSPSMGKHWFGEEDKAIDLERLPIKLPTPKRFKPKDPAKDQEVKSSSL